MNQILSSVAILSISFALGAHAVFAQPATPPAGGTSAKSRTKRAAPMAARPKNSVKAQSQNKDTGKPMSAVLDFDADIIEGEKNTPELFLQTESQTLSLDAVLYQRENFNDFHVADKDNRPQYLILEKKKK
ncbi:MAG TPA: hypothetical protein VJB59_10830 [Bdellovibrionota bacterium]|nr:hypothetical protein [Bdellovibrionota bacterium]